MPKRSLKNTYNDEGTEIPTDNDPPQKVARRTTLRGKRNRKQSNEMNCKENALTISTNCCNINASFSCPLNLQAIREVAIDFPTNGCFVHCGINSLELILAKTGFHLSFNKKIMSFVNEEICSFVSKYSNIDCSYSINEYFIKLIENMYDIAIKESEKQSLLWLNNIDSKRFINCKIKYQNHFTFDNNFKLPLYFTLNYGLNTTNMLKLSNNPNFIRKHPCWNDTKTIMIGNGNGNDSCYNNRVVKVCKETFIKTNHDMNCCSNAIECNTLMSQVGNGNSTKNDVNTFSFQFGFDTKDYYYIPNTIGNDRLKPIMFAYGKYEEMKIANIVRFNCNQLGKLPKICNLIGKYCGGCADNQEIETNCDILLSNYRKQIDNAVMNDLICATETKLYV